MAGISLNRLKKKLFASHQIEFDQSKPRPVISGDLLRDAILKADLDISANGHRNKQFCLSHAEIVGILDLSDLYPTQEQVLISLKFTDCIFRDEIDFKRSSATSLWFERTSLIKLDCEDIDRKSVV